MSDCIVTSSNAEKIVRSYPADQPILFAPDQHLGRYIRKQTGRTEQNFVVYPGSCMVHEIFSEKELVRLKLDHPEAQVLAHPECEERVLAHADFIGSTSALIKEAVRNPARVFIIATEPGVIHEMRKQAPGKEFIPAPAEGGCACNQCPHMRKNTAAKVYLALRDLTPELILPESLRLQALRPMEKMLSLS
jgi:quinolinate synthase